MLFGEGRPVVVALEHLADRVSPVAGGGGATGRVPSCPAVSAFARRQATSVTTHK
jgi:hypothetical protein